LIRTGGDTLEQVRRALIAPLHLDSGGKESSGKDRAGVDVTTPESSLFHRVDELFQDVLATLNVPTSRDLRQLQAQLDELNSKISALLEAQQNEQTAGEAAGETKVETVIDVDAVK